MARDFGEPKLGLKVLESALDRADEVEFTGKPGREGYV